MELTVNLTDAQAEVIKDELQGYAEALANDRLVRKVERARSQKLLVLSAQSDKEIFDAVAPIIAAEKAKLEVKEVEEQVNL